MTTKKDSKSKKELGLPQSETVIILRSQINFHPLNPKRHTDDAVKTQLKNFKNVGFLGGLVWNGTTGNLVSGHKRLMAMDKFYGNTKDDRREYEVKVEKVMLTEKQEKEQLIFMDSRSTNSEQQYDLLANILPDIDIELAGLDQVEVSLILSENPHLQGLGIGMGKSAEIKQDFQKIEKTAEEKKEAIKELKRQISDSIDKGQGESYVTLSFDSYENKAQFLDAMGYDSELIMIKGEQLFEKMNFNELKI